MTAAASIGVAQDSRAAGLRFLLVWIAPLALAAAVSFAPQILNDGDTFWHLATGRWMLQHGQVPAVDPFSYTYAGRPWVTHEWLSEALMALAWRFAGWSGVMLLTGLGIGATAALMARWLLRWLSPLSATATLVIGLACVAPSLLARPHILALPVLAAWTVALLEARRRGKAPSIWLLPLMILWANLHSSFIVGVGLAGALTLETALDLKVWRWRRVLAWAAFTVGALLAALVTPHGVDGLAFPLQVMNMKSLPAISEWRSPDFMKLEPVEIAVLAGLFALFYRGAKLTAVRAVMALLLVHMTFQHIRQEVLLGVMAPLLIAEPFGAALGPAPTEDQGWRLSRPQAALAAGLFAALVALRIATPERRADGPTAPITAMAHVPDALARQPVLNAYDFGGYLIFDGVKPYIDGRADMYGDDFIADHSQIMAASQSALDRAISQYGVRWAILQPGQPAVAALDRTPGWRRLYSDSYAVVLAKDGP